MNATSGFLTASECAEFVFGRYSAADPQWRAYSAPPDPLASLRGPTSKGRGQDGEGKGREGGEEENGRNRPPPRKFLDLPLTNAILRMKLDVKT